MLMDLGQISRLIFFSKIGEIHRAVFVFPTALFVCSSLLPVFRNFRKLSDKVGPRANNGKGNAADLGQKISGQ